MIRVFSTDNRLVAWNIKNILHDKGMDSVVKNDQFAGAAGETLEPQFEVCWNCGQRRLLENDHWTHR